MNKTNAPEHAPGAGIETPKHAPGAGIETPKHAPGAGIETNAHAGGGDETRLKHAPGAGFGRNLVVSVRSLSHFYEGRRILDISNLEIYKGEILVIIGPNGAGKSTLLKILGFLERPHQGEIIFSGQKITRKSDGLALRRKTGLVFQEPLLYNTTVYENISCGLKFRNQTPSQIRHKVNEWSERLGIKSLLKRNARQLSGGEAQRVNLARVFVLGPELLLLDEPFADLDPPTREDLICQLEPILCQMNVATVFVTQDRCEAARLANRIAVMNRGRIVQVGAPQEVFRRPNSRFVADFLGVENIFMGQVCIEDGLKVIDIGQLKIGAVTDLEGEVHIGIRPEDILVSRQRISSSARNSFTGKVVEIQELDAVAYVTVDLYPDNIAPQGNGHKFVSLMTRRSLEEMELTKGTQVYITFKASCVHAF